MKKRILTILVLTLTVSFTSYSTALIYADTSYYEKSLIIERISGISTIAIPFLIVLAFFKKTIKLLAGLNILFFILCFSYAFYFVGSDVMLSHYLYLPVGWLLSIILLSIVICKDKQTNTADT